MKKIPIIIAILAIGWLIYYGYNQHKILKSTQANLASTTIAYEMKLDALKKERQDIFDLFNKEKQKNDQFSEQIQGITKTVSDLEKLKTLDKELLQKYSKVYFLNENYVPKKIVIIDKAMVLPEKYPQFFQEDALKFLQKMFSAAEKDGINLRVASAYRSFSTQAAVKANHKIIYGAGTANQFSADQGYSEHQLGTTLDITTDKLGADFDNIAKDPAYQWLTDHAYQFGFVLSYPKDNKYYIFEPWHWRFVGVNLAVDMHIDKKNFYDLEQRYIDRYLLHIFD